MPPAPAITVYYDGLCSLCQREARFMQRLDKGRGVLGLCDITAPAFDPARVGRTMDQLMGQIHGLLPDGRVVTGMEVFRRAYAAVGWGWLLAPTGWPILRLIVDAGYRWFARNRLRLSPRRDACDTGRCAT